MLLQRTCEAELKKGARVTIDLKNVSFADRDGIALLRSLTDCRVELLNPLPFIAEQIRKVTLDSKKIFPGCDRWGALFAIGPKRRPNVTTGFSDSNTFDVADLANSVRRPFEWLYVCLFSVRRRGASETQNLHCEFFSLFLWRIPFAASGARRRRSPTGRRICRPT